MLRRSAYFFATAAFLVPALAFAQSQITQRVMFEGTVQEVRISERQRFEQWGGEYVVLTDAGRMMTVVLTETTNIISEGRLNRKKIMPGDITTGMRIRVTGRAAEQDTVRVSLLTITNVENNPGLTGNGVISSIDGNRVSLLHADGDTRTYTVTAETEVQVNYEMFGAEGITLIGKQVFFAINPHQPSLLRVLRVMGKPAPTPASRPSIRELQALPRRR